MWQRFTESARKCIFYAQEEAYKHGDTNVCTEHLLLGVVREPNAATHALEAMNVQPEAIRRDLLEQFTQSRSVDPGDMTLTPRAKRVIDLAYDEARNLNNNFIGAEHLLLGLTREGDGLAGRTLGKHGVDFEALRDAVKQRHKETGVPMDSEIAEKRPRPVSDRELLHIRQQRHPLDRFALMLLAEPGSATTFLENLGVHVNTLRTSLEHYVTALPGVADPNTPPSINDVIRHAVELAAGAPLTSEHLLVAIAKHSSSYLYFALKGHGVDPDKLYE
jgi:ATP-dependent Clp protease ATP-binding subunit ClpC